MGIVIPVYNVERWLPACLSSLSEQSFTDWEGVIVVDGSPDSSEEIAREFASHDSRFTVLVTPNAGLGAARNIGLSTLQTEWVSFLDSDDLLPENSLELLMEPTQAPHLDAVFGTAVDLAPGGRTIRYWSHDKSASLSPVVHHTAETSPQLFHDHVAWAKVYRRSFLTDNTITFSEGVHCEDLLFSAHVVSRARYIAQVPEAVYAHRRHAEAISTDYLRPQTFHDWMSEFEKSHTVVHQWSPSAEQSYLKRFFEHQWWSRAQCFTEFPDDAALHAFETFTAHLAESLSPEEEYPELLRALIGFFASGGVSAAWRTTEYGLNPLRFAEDLTPRYRLEVLLRGIEALDATQPAHRELGRCLLNQKVLTLLAENPLELSAAEHENVSLRLRGLVAAFGSPPPSATTPENLESIVQLTARAVRARPLASGILDLRGVVVLSGVNPAITRLELVMRSQTSPKVRAFDVWHTPLSTPGHHHWSLQLALQTELFGEEWRCLLRVHHGDMACEAPLTWEQGALTNPAAVSYEGQPGRVLLTQRSGHLAIMSVAPAPEKTIPEAPEVASSPTLFTFPRWTSNPYLTMLELEPRSSGWKITGSAIFDEAVAELASPDGAEFFHVHWTSPITEQAADEEDARTRAARFLDAARIGISHGKKLLWSLHNEVPHDARHPEAAQELHEQLASISHAAHVLSPPGELEKSLGIDAARLHHIPHSSYLGVYGARVGREKALTALGGDPERPAVLFFGQIRPYKGVDVLLRAMERAHGLGSPAQLLLAGKAEPGLRWTLRPLDEFPFSTLSHLEFVPDDQITRWFSAADVAVLPYRKLLNSGTVQLASSFGVPCILPRIPRLTETFDEKPWVRFFDPDNAVESIAALIADEFFREPEVRASADHHARSYTPYMMSTDYAELLESLRG